MTEENFDESVNYLRVIMGTKFLSYSGYSFEKKITLRNPFLIK